ncbi:MAG: YkgJ family cysteine cluster protein [Thermoguttaceae bacterium]
MSEKAWYRKGLRFECASCGGCCIGAPGYVWINKAEIAAMAASLDLDVETFSRKYVRLVGIRKSLIEFASGDCVFFDNASRECRVYEVRPRQCRAWPFWTSNLRTPESWDEMCSECPGGNKGPLLPLEEIQSRMKVLSV